jgi:YD repeat-containing protein
MYGYDVDGNLTNITSSTASGTLVTYQYDPLNRLTNVIDGRLSGVQNTAYHFDSVGNLQGTAYPNAVTNLYQYDNLNRLTNLVWKTGNTSLGTFAYTLGATGNRIGLSETISSTVARTYAWQYDDQYRLTNETVTGSAPTGTLSYQYDSVGNRVKKIVGTTTTFYLVDTLNPSGYPQVLEELTVSGGSTNLSRAYTWGFLRRQMSIRACRAMASERRQVKKFSSVFWGLCNLCG